MLSDLSLNVTHNLIRLDANAMQHGIEGRAPFLARPVLRLALNLPLEARVSGAAKGILSAVAARHLPPVFVRRRKVGGMLTPSLGWLTESARPGFLQDGMLRELLGITGPAWADLIRAAPPNQTFTLWTGEVWARLMVGGEAPAGVEAELWAS